MKNYLLPPWRRPALFNVINKQINKESASVFWDDHGTHSSGELHKLNPCADDLRNQNIVLAFKHNLWLNKEQKHRKAALWAEIWPITDSTHHTSPCVFLRKCRTRFSHSAQHCGHNKATLSLTLTKYWFSSILCPNLLGALFVLWYIKHRVPCLLSYCLQIPELIGPSS